MRTLATPRGRCHGVNEEHLRRGAGSGSPLSFLAQDSQTLVRTYVVGLRFSASNPRLLIGWQTHAINSHPALLLLFGGIYACELSQAIHGHEDVAVIKEVTTLWNHKKGDFALPGTRRVKNGCASQAWVVNGRAVALALRLFLRHALTFLCLPITGRGSAKRGVNLQALLAGRPVDRRVDEKPSSSPLWAFGSGFARGKKKCKFLLTDAPRHTTYWGVGGMATTGGHPRQMYPTFQLVFAATMGTKTSPQYVERARRFALHLPVYIRQPHSPTWLEGTTENISYTGLLFHSSYPLAPETALELRLQLVVGPKRRDGAEIRCKGAVVRVEQRNVPETPIALAVAIRDYRIVRWHMFSGGPAGMPENTVPPLKAGPRLQ